MNCLSELVGKNVMQVKSEISNTFPLDKKLDVLHDEIKTEMYVQLIIGDYILNIYNPIKLVGLNTFAELTEKKIVRVEEKTDEIIISFEKAIGMSIDLREESYNGPEAIVLYGPNNLCVVWN